MQSQQRSRLHKDEGMINQAGSLDDIYKRNLTQDPTASMTAFSAALENFSTVLSKAAMPTIASGLTSLAGGIEAISNALHDHPLIATGSGAVAATVALGTAGYSAAQLANGFGLAGSATALDASAAALDAAAVRLGVAGGVSAAEGAADKILAGGTGVAAKAARTGILGMGPAGSAALLGGALVAADGAMLYGAGAYKDANPRLFHGGAHAAHSLW